MESRSSISNIIQAAFGEEMINIMVEFLHTLPKKMQSLREEANNHADVESVSAKLGEIKEMLLALVKANIDAKMLAEAWPVVREKEKYNFDQIKHALFSSRHALIELDGIKNRMEQKYITEGSITHILRKMWENDDNANDLTIQLILSVPTRMMKLKEAIKIPANAQKCLEDIEELKSFISYNLKTADKYMLDSLIEGAQNSYNKDALVNIISSAVQIESELVSLEKQMERQSKRKSRELVRTLFTVDPSEPRSSRTRYPLRDVEAPTYKK